jgi:1-deoxy-D-xylulose-5-phosphate synthase
VSVLDALAGAESGAESGPSADLAVLADLSPGALRAMAPEDLPALADQIRRFLVACLATTGGHLGSNLGIVELTLSLHRVFESPGDALIWDTGHQTYVHKLVTGRAGAFSGLRQAEGLSGYPSRTESVHDLVENSHASTALSYACGLARARRLQGDDRTVVAVVGDGSLTGGMAYEALNNIGTHRTPVLIVLNDNGRSYAPTVWPLGAADQSATATGAGPASAFFTSLGIAYVGPVDGHDHVQLEQTLRAAASTDRPTVVHVRTVKGRGYPPAEADGDKKLHDIGPFDPATGVARGANGSTYTREFGQAMVAEASIHPELVAVTAAMAGPTGLEEFARRFPDRCIDVGIAEQHAVTVAAGMAMGGLRPVVAVYSTFLNRAWDQIYHDVGLHRLPVVFCIDRAGITGDDGPSHHGLLDLALLSKVPGMTILAPSSLGDVRAMLAQALAVTSGPVAIRWPKGEGALSTRPQPPGFTARRMRTGDQLCLVGVGRMLRACEEAAELLVSSGVDATVWDARVACPLDPDLVDDAARHTVVLTAEDGVADGGIGALLAGTLRRRHPDGTTRVVVCGVPTAYLPHGRVGDILSGLGLDGPGLAATALRALGG